MIGTFVLLGIGAFAPPPPTYDTTFVVPRGAHVSIEHRDGDVTVIGTRGREARVLIDDRESGVRIRTSEDGIQISARHDWEDSGDMILWLPFDIQLSVHGLDGDVSVVDITGDVSVETIDGSVDVSGAGRLRIGSVDGDVDVSDISGPVTVAIGDGDALLDAVSGNITVHGIDGDITVLRGDARMVTLSTISGDLWYDGRVYEGGEYSLGTHDGEVTFSLPEGVGAEVEVSTFDGSLRPSFPIQFRGGRVRGSKFTIGDGSAKVVLEAFDGDIFLIRPGERSPDRN